MCGFYAESFWGIIKSMLSFFRRGGIQKGNFHLVATIDEHSLVFMLLRIQDGKHEVERFGVQHADSSQGMFLLDDVLDDLRKKFNIQELVVSFAAPYFQIQSVRESLNRVGTNHEISQSEGRLICKKMIKQAESRIKKRLFEDSGILPDEYIVQRARVSHWEIDGYKVNSLEGFKGHGVAGTVIGSFLRQDVVSVLKKMEVKHHISKISIVHPFEGVLEKKSSGVFVYITESKTQICIVNHENFGFSDSFKPGENQFREIFRDEFGMVENIADEFYERYLVGALSEEVREKIRSFLLPEVYNFGTLVREQVEGMSIAAPENIYIFGKGVRIKEIFHMFEPATDSSLSSQETLIAQPLVPRDFKNFPSFSAHADPRYTEIFLLMQARYAKETY